MQETLTVTAQRFNTPTGVCDTEADSGKHANSFSYACEKVQAAPYARKGEGFGERGTATPNRGERIYRLRVQLKVDLV